MNIRKTIVEGLGLRRNIIGLLAMVILVGMGEKMAERFLPIYLVALGSGLLWPGFLNALDNLLSALYSFPGGWMADRFGVKRSLLIFNLLAITGFMLVVLIPRWEAVIAGSFLFLSWTAISLPGSMGLLAKSLPKQKQVMGVSMHSLVRRIPMALGPILGGIFIDIWGPITGVRIAFCGAILMSLVALVAQQLLIENDARAPIATDQGQTPFALLRQFSPALKRLLVADILVRFCEQIPYAYVVLWCMTDVAGYGTARVSGAEFGLLTTFEMITAMLCYIPVALWADKSAKKPFVAMTFLNFALFPLALLFCRGFWPLAAAFVLRGLKEFGEPTRKALIMELVPAGRKTAAFGTYYLARDAVVALGAALGAFLWVWGPAANFLTAFAFGLAGTAWFCLAGRDRNSATI